MRWKTALAVVLVTGGCQCEDFFAQRRGDQAPPKLPGPVSEEAPIASAPPAPPPVRRAIAPAVATPAPVPSPTPVLAETTPSPTPPPAELPADRRDPAPTRLRRPFGFEGNRPPFNMRKSLMPGIRGTRTPQVEPAEGE